VVAPTVLNLRILRLQTRSFFFSIALFSCGFFATPVADI
jgi:hypothetical protein